MKSENHKKRAFRTRTLVQIGGLFWRSGLMDAFVIEAGEDLQSPESLQKAARLLGFLNGCLESASFDAEQLGEWQNVGRGCCDRAHPEILLGTPRVTDVSGPFFFSGFEDPRETNL